MSIANVIHSKVRRLEELPNELFLLVFSYLKSDIVIEAFVNLNQRFQSLIYQLTRHLVLPTNIEPSWINKCMSSIMNDIETITLHVRLVGSVFSCKYSYPNLRLIIIYLRTEWQVELNIENESPVAAICSALNVLGQCSFEGTNRDLSKIFGSEHMTQTIASTKTNKTVANYTLNDIDHISPCSAIRRIWILENDERNLWKLCELAPELTYIKIWLRSSSKLNYDLGVAPAQNILPKRLTELYIKLIDIQSFKSVRLFISHYQASLRRIMLDCGRDIMIDGRKLEDLFAPYILLEDVSFISQFSKKQTNISDLLCSFQSEWWLDTRRPLVLIHETDFDHILAMSIPCSFSNILKNFQFSTDLSSWHLNKGKLDSLSIGCLKLSKICFSSKQPINLDFLQFAAQIFYCQKQILACNFWGLIFEEELFRQLVNKSIVETILPNVTRFKITHVNGLNPLTLAVWLLLAPNVRMLEIEYLTFSETIEWIMELKDAFLIDNQRLKMIFQRIQKITISFICYNGNEKSKLEMCTILTKIFSTATIN